MKAITALLTIKDRRTAEHYKLHCRQILPYGVAINLCCAWLCFYVYDAKGPDTDFLACIAVSLFGVLLTVLIVYLYVASLRWLEHNR